MQNTRNYSINNDVECPKIISMDISLKKLKNMSFSLGEKTTVRLKNPTELYIKESLNTMRVSPGVRQRAESYLSKKSIENNERLVKFDDLDRSKVLEKIVTSLKNQKKFPELSKRECRALLSYDKIYSSQLKTPFLQYMMDNNSSPSTRIIKTLIITYFSLYNNLNNDNEFKSYFIYALKKYLKQIRRIPPSIEIYTSDCDILKDNFCSDLAKKCLEIKLETKEDLNKIIENRYQLILPNTDIYDELIKEIGLECFKKIKDEVYFDILVNEILQSKLKKSKMDEIVSRLLLLFGKTSELTANKQNILRKILLQSKYYGDPRIYPANWEGGIDKEARRIFISWLAKEDLEFFFNVVFYDKLDEHGRKIFWQQYIKSRELQYSKVILSNEDASHPKIREAIKDGREFATFKASMDGSSCFILVFDSATIVEFSQTGNALYIYDNKESGIRADKMKYGSVGELKKSNVKEYTNDMSYPDLEYYGAIRIRHIDRWQRKTKEYLGKKLHIYEGD